MSRTNHQIKKILSYTIISFETRVAHERHLLILLVATWPAVDAQTRIDFAGIADTVFVVEISRIVY